MKKILVLAVAMMMVLCAAALAEEELTINPEEVAVDLTVELDKLLDGQIEFTEINYAVNEPSKEMIFPIDLIPAEAFAAGSVDSVVRNGEKYIVDNGTLKYTLDMSKLPAYLCFTQDKMASFSAYLRINDPNGFLKHMIDNEINYYLVDTETNLQVVIFMGETDQLTQMVGNFSALSNANKQTVASMLINNPEIKQAGNMSWIKINDRNLVTIAKDYYVFTQIGGTDDPGSDMLDTLDVLSYLTIE